LGRISPHLGPEIFGQANECWQTAMETLLLVAERDGSEMMARIGMMPALNRHRAKADALPERARAYRLIR